MAQYRDKCRASLKAVLISVFYKMREISWLVEKLLVFWLVRFRSVLNRSHLEIRGSSNVYSQRATTLTEFLWSFSFPPCKYLDSTYLKLGQERFLSHYYQFFIH
jgi:hypothetical protein